MLKIKKVLLCLGPNLAIDFPIVHRKHKYLLSKVLLDQNWIMLVWFRSHSGVISHLYS